MITRNQQGISIIEVILMLAVAAVIITASFTQYKSYQSNRDAAATRSGVEIIMNALEAYFQSSCTSLPQRMLNTIKASQLAPYLPAKANELLINPYSQLPVFTDNASDSVYSAQIDTRQTPWTMSVILTFPKVMREQYFNELAGQLKPSAADWSSRQMIWAKLPSTQMEQGDDPQWQLTAFTQGFASINYQTGLSSDLNAAGSVSGTNFNDPCIIQQMNQQSGN